MLAFATATSMSIAARLEIEVAASYAVPFEAPARHSSLYHQVLEPPKATPSLESKDGPRSKWTITSSGGLPPITSCRRERLNCPRLAV